MLSKEEIKEWILENAVNNNGEIDLSYIDFGERRISLSGIKAFSIDNSRQESIGWIYNSDQIANNGCIENRYQESKTNSIINNCQKAKIDICNNSQEAECWVNNEQQRGREISNKRQKADSIYNIEQSATERLVNEKQKSKFDIYNDYQIADEIYNNHQSATTIINDHQKGKEISNKRQTANKVYN